MFKWISFNEDRFGEVTKLIPTLSRQRRPERGAILNRLDARMMSAQAFEQSGMIDSAITYYEIVLSQEGLHAGEIRARGTLYPFALTRLVLLCVQEGRIERAEQHWNTLVETVTRPDPEVQGLIDEAQATLANAKAMAAAEQE